MANYHEHDRAAEIENEEIQHEESDVNIRSIFGFGIGLFVVAVVIHVAIYVLFVFFTNQEAKANASPQYPLAAGQESRLPPEPRLQTNPRQDLQDLRAQEDATLNGYSWVDRNAGVVRIPIADAMKLTLQRGLPARPQAPQNGAAAAMPASAAQGSAAAK